MYVYIENNRWTKKDVRLKNRSNNKSINVSDESSDCSTNLEPATLIIP